MRISVKSYIELLSGRECNKAFALGDKYYAQFSSGECDTLTITEKGVSYRAIEQRVFDKASKNAEPVIDGTYAEGSAISRLCTVILSQAVKLASLTSLPILVDYSILSSAGALHKEKAFAGKGVFFTEEV